MLVTASMQIALRTEKKIFFNSKSYCCVVPHAVYWLNLFHFDVSILYYVRVQLHVIKAFAFKLEFRRSRRQVLRQVGGQRLSGAGCTDTAQAWLCTYDGMKTLAVPLGCCLRKPACCSSSFLPVF